MGAVHELALPVDRSRIANRTTPGDRVTVLTTLSHGDTTATVVAIEDAMVLQWSGEGVASGNGVLTLAIDDADTAMSLAHPARQGSVTVVRNHPSRRRPLSLVYVYEGPDTHSCREGTTDAGIGREARRGPQ